MAIETEVGETSCGRIGHGMDSMTKSINAHTLQEDCEELIVDSCGFEDTEGPEVDIANAVGLRNAMKTCKSIRPVILIPVSTTGIENRLAYKKLMDLIKRFFSPVETVVNQFSFIFTHCDVNFTWQKLKQNLLLLKVSDQIKDDPSLFKITERIITYVEIEKDAVFLREDDLISGANKQREVLERIREKEPIDNRRLQTLSTPLSDGSIAQLQSSCSKAVIEINVSMSRLYLHSDELCKIESKDLQHITYLVYI